MGMLSLFSWSNPQLTRKVLFTLEQHEIIGFHPNDSTPFEKNFISTLSPSNEYLYSCRLVDTITNSSSFVWNGERKVKSDKYDGILIVEECINLFDFSKCTYQYILGNDYFLIIEGTLYGPYEGINYQYPNESSHTYINKHQFDFILMGTQFTHYNDGVIMPSDIARMEFTSNNGSHSIKFSKDWSTIILDKKTMPSPKFNSPVSCFDEVCFLNNGNCTFVAYTPYYAGRYIATAQGVKKIDWVRNKFFSFKTGKQEPYKHTEDLQNIIQDNSKKHSFFFKEGYNYIIIDGQKYGKSSPLKASYEKSLNAFIWVAVENQELVLYTYYLN